MSFDPEKFYAEELAHFVEAMTEDLPAIEAEAGAAARWKSAQAIVEAALGRSRQRFAALRGFADDSLVGSYFRAPDPDDTEAEAAWLDGEPCSIVRGIVHTQPFVTNQNTLYLVEFFSGEGFTGRQQLVDIDRMHAQRWAFYDTEGWLSLGEKIKEPAKETAE